MFSVETTMTTSRESRRMETDVVGSYRNDRLSPRQRELLRYVVEGYSNKAIAAQLGLAEATVQIQLKCLLSKIRVANRTEATIWALANLPELEIRALVQI